MPSSEFSISFPHFHHSREGVSFRVINHGKLYLNYVLGFIVNWLDQLKDLNRKLR